jgi:8-oxo-dGTP pyrophosphatase MutT (NUDIX family)
VTAAAPDPAAQPWVRVGAYAIVTDALERLLLCRIAPGYPLAGRWTLPGGGVDFGEHPDDAVLRELHEETGLTGVRGAVAGIWSGHIPRPLTRPGPLHWVAILYHVVTEPGDLRLEVGGSTDECRWVDLPDVAALERTDLVDGALQALGLAVDRGPGPDAGGH